MIALLAAAFAADHVLLIGVGDYPDASPLADDTPWEDLASARDLELLGQAARSRGVPAEHITTVLDAEATRAGVVSALEGLAGRLQPGDRAWVHWSGHGQRLRDDDDDEGIDEALVPWGAPRDLPMAYDGAHHLRDDDVAELLVALRVATSPSGAVVFTVDSCHAGGVQRGRVGRGGPDQAGLTGRSSATFEADDDVGRAPLVFLAAATSDQIAEELDLPDGRVGAFSAGLARALGEGDTWRDVHAQIRASLRTRSPGQTPVLDGDGSLGVFAHAQEGVPVYLLTPDRIDAGTLLGVREGATVRVDGREGRVVAAGLLTSTVALDGARAGERAEVALVPAPVRVEGSGPDVAALVGRVDADPLLTHGAGPSASLVEGAWHPSGARTLREAHRHLRRQALVARLAAGGDAAVKATVLAPGQVALGDRFEVSVRHEGTTAAWVTLVVEAPDGVVSVLDVLEPLAPGETRRIARARASGGAGLARVHVLTATHPIDLSRLDAVVVEERGVRLSSAVHAEAVVQAEMTVLSSP